MIIINIKNNKLFVLCGQMGSGKDTYGDEFQQIIPNKYNVIRYSFATALRDELYKVLYLFRSKEKEEVKLKLNINEEEYNITKSIILNIPHGHDPYSRTLPMRNLLQYWGTDVRRNQNPNYWVNLTISKIHELLKDDNNIIYMTDARFINECVALKEIGAKLIFLQADENIRIERIRARDGVIPTTESLSHKSETEILNYNDFDLIIDTEEVELDNIKEYITKKLLK